MKIDEIHSEWDVDSTVDIHHLDKEATKIPKLHGKYLRYLSNERLLLYKYQADFKRINVLKLEYYSGITPEEELREKGIKPYPKLILKNDLETYIESDVEVIELSLKIGLQKEKISTLESILNTLGNRGYQIRSAIDFQKMQNGY